MDDLGLTTTRRSVDDLEYSSRGFNTAALEALTRRPRRDILAIAILGCCVLAIGVGAGAQVVRSGSPEFAVETLRKAALSKRPGAIKPLLDKDAVLAQARGYVVRHLEFYHAHDIEYRVALAAPKGQQKLGLYLDYKLGGLFAKGNSVFSEEPASIGKGKDDAVVVAYPSYRYISSLDEIEFVLGRSQAGRWKVERISNDSLAKMFPDDQFLSKDFVAYLASLERDE